LTLWEPAAADGLPFVKGTLRPREGLPLGEGTRENELDPVQLVSSSEAALVAKGFWLTRKTVAESELPATGHVT